MNDKNADGQAGQKHGAAPSQEGHAAGPACSAPDEALIQRIAQEVYCAWSNGDLSFNKSIRWAICEYIRRSAGKEKS